MFALPHSSTPPILHSSPAGDILKGMFVPLVVILSAQSHPSVLPRTHSHNDYAQTRPLAEALDNGFSSVEADVFLVDGKLLVGHNRKELTPERNLEAMYLKPLSDRMTRQKGSIYPNSNRTFWLLIDVKADGPNVYGALKVSLARFPSLKQPNIRLVISGERPAEDILRDKGLFAALDGRWADLDKGYSRDLMPWVSEDWSAHFKWQGVGPMPEEESVMIRSMVKTVHDQKRLLRFWGAPDTKEIWYAQWSAGVDLINTDHLAQLRAWMLSQAK